MCVLPWGGHSPALINCRGTGGFSSPRARTPAPAGAWLPSPSGLRGTRRVLTHGGPLPGADPRLPAAGTMPPFKAPCPGERGRSHASRGKAGGAQKDVRLPELGFGCSRAACLSCAFKGSADVWRRSSFKLQNSSGCLHRAGSCNAGQSCRGRGAHVDAHATASHARTGGHSVTQALTHHGSEQGLELEVSRGCFQHQPFRGSANGL